MPIALQGANCSNVQPTPKIMKTHVATMLYCHMDWNILKKFKNQIHLVRSAVKDTSQTNIHFNITYDKDKGITHSLDLPPENEIVRFATVLRPLADPSSPLYFKGIASMLIENNIPEISIPDKQILE